MHYLLKEFNRLVKYAEGLGIKVIYSKKKSNASAEWATDGSEITIYDKDKKSPMMLVVDLLHELAHHKAWLASGRKEDLKTDKILDKEAAGLELTELQRKHIYDMECADSKFQAVIHHEVGSKLPLWRLETEIELDLWIYKHFWLKGTWPMLKEIKQKKKELLAKRRPK